LASFQFSLTLSAKISTNYEENKSSMRKCYDLVFGTEIWALIIVLLCQDLPFFIMRLLILFNVQILHQNYNFYFFVVKNFILVFFDIYYIVSIILEQKELKKHHKRHNHNENQVEEIAKS
jgi:uncharacterized membrane protein